jgi:SagB-type dehydrogenase family enzyme
MATPANTVCNPYAADCAREFHRSTSLTGDGTTGLHARLAPAQVEPIDLPELVPMDAPPLEATIAARRTRRAFDCNGVIALEQLARLAVLSAGRTALAEPGSWSPPQGHRAVPSAGATYPVDVHLVARRVRGLLPGAYRYDVQRHALWACRNGIDEGRLERATLDQSWMRAAAVIFALVGTLDRIAPRYASRGYRYMLFEAGHVAQNLYLLGTAHGLCVQATGGFMDRAIADLLGLRPDQDPLYLLAVGPGVS